MEPQRPPCVHQVYPRHYSPPTPPVAQGADRPKRVRDRFPPSGANFAMDRVLIIERMFDKSRKVRAQSQRTTDVSPLISAVSDGAEKERDHLRMTALSN